MITDETPPREALIDSRMNKLRVNLRFAQCLSTNFINSGSSDIDIIALIKGTESIPVFNYYTGQTRTYRHHTNYSNARRKTRRYFSNVLQAAP